MAVIEKSETGRRHIGALQTVAKLLGKASYFNFYDLKSQPQLRMPVTPQNFFQCRVTKAVAAASLLGRPMPPSKPVFSLPKGIPSMTISTRLALGISAAALSFSLALAPVAFAQDAMKKDDGMKKDSMSKNDGMKKDTMSKDSMKKDDGMKKKDSMSK
jgi:pentapeptide MXKDX repeat protein